MNSVGIIGIGSQIGLDNISQLIIQQLKKKIVNYKFSNQVHVDYYDRPNIYLLEIIENFKLVYLIDAIQGNKKIGEIYKYEHFEVFEKKSILLSSHEFGMIELLELGKTLNLLPNKVIIYGISIGDIFKSDLILKPSLAILRSCVTIGRQVISELETYFSLGTSTILS